MTTETGRSYSSLSVCDLLEAREAYHVHLSKLENVEATAIGRYRIRKNEPNADSPDAVAQYGEEKYGARTLMDTVVRPWSWPCVLVFVKQWSPLASLSNRADQAVPRRLYLPDGRVVPTCVLSVKRDEEGRPGLEELNFPSSLVGGGYPVITDSQGVQQIGSIGCLVTNGETIFALTNRHVAGEPGREVFTHINGVRERIGLSDPRQIGKLEFNKVYQQWPSARAFVNLDAGLIRIDSIYDWTAQVFGIGKVGKVKDLSAYSISLDLIGCHVRAFGGVSGVLEGEIQGLFFRYRSLGGMDFVADVLIGRRGEGTPVRTRPGDSGTVWFLDPPSRQGARRSKLRERAELEAAEIEERMQRGGRRETAPVRPDEISPGLEAGADAGTEDRNELEAKRQARRLRPIALQWGGERYVSGMDGEAVQFALGTFMSTICRELDVEVVCDWNIGHSEYWGKTSHFKIGMKTCDLLSTPALRILMLRNRSNIGFDDEVLSAGREFRVGRGQFVPLADVPDYIWVAAAHTRNPGGRKYEMLQHFADMDQPGHNGYAGRTLLDLCRDPAAVDPIEWQRFYDSIPDQLRPDEGCLPFRIWQCYDAMVGAALGRDPETFVCVAGILAHYIGDACQPLHISQYHHGKGPAGGKSSPDWPAFKASREYKVHSIYEQVMFEVRAVEMLSAINRELDGISVQGAIRGGKDAAIEAVRLMQSSYAGLPPLTIIDADVPEESQPARGRILWDAVGPKTAKLVAEGCKLLARLWESAWKEGRGDRIAAADLKRIPEENINRVVRDRSFLPAMRLEEFAASIRRT